MNKIHSIIKQLMSRNKELDVNSQQKFENLMAYVASDDIRLGNRKARIQYLCNIIVEYLNYREVVIKLQNASDDIDNSSIYDIYSELEYHLGEKAQVKILQTPYELEINELAILLNPWNGRRVIENLFGINSNNVFDGEKYQYNIKIPMNIVICSGANHSQFAARYKNQGQTIIREVCDYSNLYDRVIFDGKGFKDKQISKYISFYNHFDRELIFYAGVLFEMGRYNMAI